MSTEASTAESKRCSAHGLLFNPRVHSGCVVCRREIGETAVAPIAAVAAEPTSRAWMFVAAGLMLSCAGWLAWTSLRSASDVTIGNLADTLPHGAYADARRECVDTLDECDANCRAQPTSQWSCRQGCLNGLHECEVQSAGVAGKAIEPSSYSFGVGKMPPWLDILRASIGLNEKLLACGTDTFMARVSVQRDGHVKELLVAATKPNEVVEICQKDVMRAWKYPAVNRAYTFVSSIDPRMDSELLVIRQAEQEIARQRNSGEQETARRLTIMVWDLKQARAQRAAEKEREEEEKRKAAMPKPVAVTSIPPLAPLSHPPPKPTLDLDDAPLHAGRTRIGSGGDKFNAESPGGLIDTRARNRYDRSNSQYETDRELQRLRDDRQRAESRDEGRRAQQRSQAECDAWRARLLHSGTPPEKLPPCNGGGYYYRDYY